MASWNGFVERLRWATASLLLLSFSLGAEPLDQPETQPVLRLLTLENPPLEFAAPDGKATGILVDVVREAARRTGRKVSVDIYPWKRVINEVAMGHADGAFNAGRNAERETWAHYHQSILVDETFVFFSRQPIALSDSLAEAPQLSIGTQLGYFYGNDFERMRTEAPFESVLEVASIGHNLRLLMGNRTDVFIGDMLPTLHYIEKMGLVGKIHIVQNKDSGGPLLVSLSPTYVAFSRKTVDESYVRAFDAALDAMKSDGTYASIFADYGVQVPARESSAATVSVAVP